MKIVNLGTKLIVFFLILCILIVMTGCTKEEALSQKTESPVQDTIPQDATEFNVKDEDASSKEAEIQREKNVLIGTWQVTSCQVV